MCEQWLSGATRSTHSISGSKEVVPGRDATKGSCGVLAIKVSVRCAELNRTDK